MYMDAMRKIAFLLLLAAAPALPRAQAQTSPEGAIEDACSNELSLLCSNPAEKPFDCLISNEANLTSNCQKAFAAEMKRREDHQRERARKQAEAGIAEIPPPQPSMPPSAAAAPPPGPASAKAPAIADRDARLTFLSGAVYLHTSKQAEGEFVEAEKDFPLAAGDIVRTGTDGSAELSIDGGSVIELSANSDFIVNSLNPAGAEFHLGIGRMLAKLRKLAQGQRISFRTSSAVAAVRGTELAVEQAEGDAPTRIGVFDEGLVSVTNADGTREIELKPNQETEIAKNQAPAAPRALKAFAERKKELVEARRRFETLPARWRSQSPDELSRMRGRLAEARAFKCQDLPKVRESLRLRAYPELQRRQNELRKKGGDGVGATSPSSHPGNASGAVGVAHPGAQGLAAHSPGEKAAPGAWEHGRAAPTAPGNLHPGSPGQGPAAQPQGPRGSGPRGGPGPAGGPGNHAPSPEGPQGARSPENSRAGPPSGGGPGQQGGHPAGGRR